MSKKVMITQSNYIPWKGYFDAINQVDEVILYDDMQYTKRDWRNRNKIKTPQGLKWLTIPVKVKGKFDQSIKETRISDKGWNEKHWNQIHQNYAKGKYYERYKERIQELYLACDEEFLSDINLRFLEGINDILGISTPLRFSSDFSLVEGKTERLVDLCKKVGATEYWSGPGAKDYMDESLFNNEGIQVYYFDYSGYPEYEQIYGPFEHGVTVLDLIFNVGPNAQNYMKSFS